MTPRDAFSLLSQKDLNTVHHALRMLGKYPDEAVDANRLADAAWEEHCSRVGARDGEEGSS